MSVLSTYKGGSSQPNIHEVVQMKVDRLTSRTTSGHIIPTTTRADVGHLVTITPKYQDSVFRIRVNSNMHYAHSSVQMWSIHKTVDGVGSWVVYNTGSGENWYGAMYSNHQAWNGVAAVWYDTPNTTSDIEYRVYTVANSSANTMYYMHYAQMSFLEVSEIKAS